MTASPNDFKAQYHVLSTEDHIHSTHDSPSDRIEESTAVRNDKPFPISKPPPQYRDFFYSVIFVFHFLGIILLSLIESTSITDSMINYSRSGSWASIVMIVTLLGSFLGGIVSLLLGTSEIREGLLNAGITFSLIMKICVGNILLIIRSNYSLFGVLLLISALVDSFWYKHAKESIPFTVALLQMVVDCTSSYGSSFFFACFSILFFQTCILLWWGAFFVGLLSTVSSHGYIVVILIILMSLSLFWISQFFRCLMSFVVGGCVVWSFFPSPIANNNNNEDIGKSDKLLLYLQCGVSTSLGSLCKGALLIPICQSILSMEYWMPRLRPSPTVMDFAMSNPRISLCLLATYGRTLRTTADDLADSLPSGND